MLGCNEGPTVMRFLCLKIINNKKASPPMTSDRGRGRGWTSFWVGAGPSTVASWDTHTPPPSTLPLWTTEGQTENITFPSCVVDNKAHPLTIRTSALRTLFERSFPPRLVPCSNDTHYLHHCLGRPPSLHGQKLLHP